MANPELPSETEPEPISNDDGTLRSTQLFERILDIADDAIISVDQQQRILIFNEGATRIFGYNATEVLGRPLDILLPERFRQSHRSHIPEFGHAQESSRRMGERGEISGRRRDGTEFPAEASISRVEIGGSLVFTVILRDVSAARQAEDRLRAALREKEVLLKEVHHRVKNNLQVISSLLSLQSRSIFDEASRQMFKESQHRVLSMALIHEQLYQSSGLADLDLSVYIQELASNLFRSYQVSSSRVDLETRIDEISLDINVAVPCGLILNELISNGLKYAFPGGRSGIIRISLQRHEGDSVELVVADNGIGLPESIGFLDTNTLGLRLVRLLVAQLQGEATISREAGTEIRIRFPATA